MACTIENRNIMVAHNHLRLVAEQHIHSPMKAIGDFNKTIYTLDIFLNWSCDMNIAINNFSTRHHFKALHGAFPKFGRNCIYL